jgi:Pyruvate/2-oxoacid:ferredoxin oxidoreductase delta subunit
MFRRKIVCIDEAKCDGCGECISSCAEGAIRIIDGTARLVSDVYCDGLGACLGKCPRDAISIIEREAEPFDELATHAHLAALREPAKPAASVIACPGTAVRNLQLNVLPSPPSPTLNSHPPTPHSNGLVNWPIQLQLVPPNAPFLRNADVLLAADCVPVALADFHRRYPNGNPLLLACPKLDNAAAYVQKLGQMIRASGLRSITVLHMEVPCCTGLVRIAQSAIAMSGLEIPLRDITVTIAGAEVASAVPTGRLA